MIPHRNFAQFVNNTSKDRSVWHNLEQSIAQAIALFISSIMQQELAKRIVKDKRPHGGHSVDDYGRTINSEMRTSVNVRR